MAGLAGLALALAVILVANSFIQRGVCAYYGSQTNRETRYAMFVGCMVKAGDFWVPRKELRSIQ